MITHKSSPEPSTEEPQRARDGLKRAILARFPVRVHLSLILAGCFATGLLVTTLLHLAGLQEMLIRYPLALAAAYGAFVLGVRVWLQYAGYGRAIDAERKSSLVDGVSSSGEGGWWTGLSGPGSKPAVFSGGGGASGGAGASASFDAGSASEGAATKAMGGVAASSSSSGGSSLDVDLDDGVWVVVALLAALAAVFGAAIYLIYAAPTILCDAAFAALLSGGLIRSTHRIADSGWMGSVVRDTWLPFAGVLVLTVVFAAVVRHVYPGAHTMTEVLRRL